MKTERSTNTPNQSSCDNQTFGQEQQITVVTPFSKHLAIVLFIILPFVGIWLGVKYVKPMQSLKVPTETNQKLVATKDLSKDQLGTSDVLVDVTLSPLSAPRAKVDIFWNYKVPEEIELLKKNPRAELRGPIVAIAEPLVLIESFTVRNNSNESIKLYSISNEQLDHIKVIPRTNSNEKATPLMLLGDSLRRNDDSLVECQDRNVIKTLQNSFTIFPNPLKLGNNCVFDQPEIIAPGETLTLRPVPYLVSYGKTGDIVVDPFFGSTKTIFEINNPVTGNKQWLLPEAFKKYDDVLQDNTFNVGGYIVANVNNNRVLNDVFNLRKSDGSTVSAVLGKTEYGQSLMAYDIPLDPFDMHSAASSEIFGLQSFLYLNGFLTNDNITGVIGPKTIKALKEFQKSTDVYPTGQFDTATAHAAHSSEFINLLKLYENYGDENIYLGLSTKEPYFRYWGVGEYEVERNNDFSNVSFVMEYRMKSDSSGFYFKKVDGSTKGATFRSFSIINNTAQIQSCEIFSQNGGSLSKFSIPVNGISYVSAYASDVKQLTTRHLRCGEKEMIIEVLPGTEQRG
jgi:hypothetical protein